MGIDIRLVHHILHHELQLQYLPYPRKLSHSSRAARPPLQPNRHCSPHPLDIMLMPQLIRASSQRVDSSYTCKGKQKRQSTSHSPGMCMTEVDLPFQRNSPAELLDASRPSKPSAKHQDGQPGTLHSKVLVLVLQ